MKKTFILLVFCIFASLPSAHAQLLRMTAAEFSSDLTPRLYDENVKCVFLMYSNDCDYSLRVYRSLDELSYEFSEIPFYAICIDKDMWLLNRYNMKGVPTYGFINYSDSQMYSGVFSTDELRRKLHQMFR